MRRRGHATEALYTRDERIGFVSRDVDYEVSGTFTEGSPGTRLDPPDEGGVELLSVVRIDPETTERTDLKPSQWPFSDEELSDIHLALTKELDVYEQEDDYRTPDDD